METKPVELPLEKIASFCRKWDIRELSLFGSALRADFQPESDIDFLVTFGPQTRYSLLDVIRIQNELSALVGRDVDLAERSAVEASENYIRRRHILSTARRIYVAG